MAFDGITVSALVAELNKNILNGRISKIAQPEADELLLTIKGSQEGSKRLLISASASLPLIYFTENNKPSPITAPAFCMLLRKHISNGRILSITQPGLERVINIRIEHLNEMGDTCQKILIIELMGKYSNIIFTDDDGVIIDAIKRIPSSVSSVREVLPGRKYFIPETTGKSNPLIASYEAFSKLILSSSSPVAKALSSSFTGISLFYANEICYEAGIDGDTILTEDNTDTNVSLNRLYNVFTAVVDSINNASYSPNIVYENGIPFEYAALPLKSFSVENTTCFENMSLLLETYYREKALYTRMRAKSTDLRKIVDTILERDVKKYDLQLKQMEDTKKRDKYRIYGELLNAYGYSVEEGQDKATVLNYYTNENVTIPLDNTLSPQENAQKYFNRYNKLKRTFEALSELTEEVKAEIDHLDSVKTALSIATSEDDLNAIKEEMILSGYIRRKASDKKTKVKSKPLHYITDDGFHIYVGKNNLQNEEITFQLANSNDWWFHAKKRPGSHVILRTGGQEVSDSAFEAAAKLAAYYSQARGESRIEVDYVKRKEVKHPNGSKPGFVVYYTNYSMLIEPDISNIKLVTD